MLRLIFVTDATAAGRLWSIRQNHPESGSDVLNVYHCQQRVYKEIYVKEQVSLEGGRVQLSICANRRSSWSRALRPYGSALPVKGLNHKKESLS